MLFGDVAPTLTTAPKSARKTNPEAGRRTNSCAQVATIDGKRALHDAVRDLLCGSDYRRLSRTEIYSDRWAGYHMDTVEQLSGGYQQYRIPGAASSWSTLPDNETHQIISVAVYLQARRPSA